MNRTDHADRAAPTVSTHTRWVSAQGAAELLAEVAHSAAVGARGARRQRRA